MSITCDNNYYEIRLYTEIVVCRLYYCNILVLVYYYYEAVLQCIHVHVLYMYFTCTVHVCVYIILQGCVIVYTWTCTVHTCMYIHYIIGMYYSVYMYMYCTCTLHVLYMYVYTLYYRDVLQCIHEHVLYIHVCTYIIL